MLDKKILDFATKAHQGQLRKYTNEDYILHPIEVAHRLFNVGYDDNIVSAALLHDVLEDTKVTYEQLRVFLFSNQLVEDARDILNLVVELTDVYTKENFPHLNRKIRKQLEATRLSTVSYRAKLIKMEDIKHNSESIVANDPNFAEVFLKEKEFLIKCLQMPK